MAMGQIDLKTSSRSNKTLPRELQKGLEKSEYGKEGIRHEG